MYSSDWPLEQTRDSREFALSWCMIEGEGGLLRPKPLRGGEDLWALCSILLNDKRVSNDTQTL